MDCFWKGLGLFVDPAILRDLFYLDELPILVSGQRKLNFAELQKSTLYGEFTEKHPMIQWFWQIVIDEWDDDKRRKLLQFSTGTDRAPIAGLKSLHFTIVKDKGDPDRLPNSHTCFNRLDLPEYASKEVLRKNLEIAIE